MPRSILSRLLVAAICSLTAFAAPGEALAHGIAHHEAHEAQAHPHADATGDPTGDAAVGAADHEHEHAHPRLDGVVRTRAEGLAVVLPARVSIPAAQLASVRTGTPFRRATLARGDPGTGPPPRLRAPPAR